MGADPSSGPGAGLVARQVTPLTSAQIKALFTTPIAVSPTPRSDQIIVPIQWSAVAANSAANYANPGSGALNFGYHPRGEQVALADLLVALSLGDPSFLVGAAPTLLLGQLTDAPGSPLEIAMDTANLTTGTFPVTFTLFYAVIDAT